MTSFFIKLSLNGIPNLKSNVLSPGAQLQTHSLILCLPPQVKRTQVLHSFLQRGACSVSLLCLKKMIMLEEEHQCKHFCSIIGHGHTTWLLLPQLPPILTPDPPSINGLISFADLQGEGIHPRLPKVLLFLVQKAENVIAFANEQKPPTQRASTAPWFTEAAHRSLPQDAIPFLLEEYTYVLFI